MATLLGLYPWVSARTSLSSESQALTGLLPRKKRSAVALAALEARSIVLWRITLPEIEIKLVLVV